MELLCPESKKLVKIIGSGIGIAIVPAINQTQDLRVPVPIASGMHRGVHSRLHSIKIMNLVRQFCVIVRNYQWIHCSENNRDVRAQRVHCTLTKIKKLCKALRSDIRGSSALLHLFVA